MPIAYFLIDGLNTDVKSNLVIEAINQLQAANIQVVSLICDGPSTNFAVGAKLGASLTAENMKPVFTHPSRDDWVVNIISDATHMLKLMRNTIAEKRILTDYAVKHIRWQHIKDLYELQNKEGLKAANTLKRSHVEWYQHKSRV